MMDQAPEKSSGSGPLTPERQARIWHVELPANLQDAVSAALREAARSLVVPSFYNPGTTDVSRRESGSLVTQIDREVEQRLSEVATALLPKSLVIGEEKVASDPSLLTRIGEEWAWLIDPVDGTANFVEGKKPIAMMIALLYRGTPVLAWILDPLEDVLLIASKSESASSHIASTTAPEVGTLRGAAWTRYFDDGLRSAIEGRFPVLGNVSPGSKCTGAEYLAVLQGRQDFVLFWRSMPWDHAAGILLLQESGGYAAYLNRDPFRPGAKRFGLLVARSETVWNQVWSALIAGVADPEHLLVREMQAY
jgi:fructose-1,6-bisphosphatase/inositol monophosphatase family enzyme